MSLEDVFYPNSLAVIGASKEVGSVGNEIAKNLAKEGYRGKLYLVNPKGGRLFGHKVLTGLERIKTPLTLAIIAIPAPLVVEEVKQLLALKVKAIVVISAGFAEAGNQSAQNELAAICKQYGIVLIGPNCLGVINADIKLNASFAPIMPKSGPIAFISQSGALCASVLDYAAQRNIGFSKFISVGNKALIGELELLDYLYRDNKTKVIAIYMEELEKAELLKKTAAQITQGKPGKPIVVLKAGRTSEGQKTALSHTGSLGGSDAAYDALFAQTGMIRAQTIEELFDIVECFVRNYELKKNRVAVVTNAGGPGVISADALVASGLKLANLEQSTVSKLEKFLPKAASVKNPVDILGDAKADRYKKTLELVLADPNVGAVEIILTPQSMTEVKKTAKVIVNLKKTSKKPIIVNFMGQDLVQEGVDILNKNSVATSYYPESASRALAALNIFRKMHEAKRKKPLHFKNVKQKAVQKILEVNLQKSGKLLPMDTAFEILESYGLPTVKRWFVTSRDSVPKLAKETEGLLALKIVSAQINHKSDIGGVVLGVLPNNLEHEYEKLIAHIKKALPKAAIDGVEVMQMVKGEGVELIIGAKTDPKLGKQIMVGLGGTYAEVFQDVSWGLTPLSGLDTERMIAHLKTAKILAGFRGHEPFAVEKVEECLGRLSQLVVDFPQIAEVDINPLIVLDNKNGARVVDARIVLM